MPFKLFYKITGLAVAVGAVLLLAEAPAQAENCTKAQDLTGQAQQYVQTNPGLSEELLSEALGMCDRSASIRYNLAQVKMMLFKYGEAKVYLTEAVRRRPNYDRAHHALAQVYMKEGNQAQATYHAQMAVNLVPRNPDYMRTLSAATDVETPPKTSISLPDAVAVVIGNKNYEHDILAKAPVEYALNDAKTIKEYLVQAMGFNAQNIIHLENATLTDFMKIFGDERDHRGLLFGRVKKGASKIFVFYSGHGAPDTNTKKAFIIPTDADPAVVRFTSYSLDVLNENLAKIGQEKEVGEVILALDSCFSGGYNNGMIIPGASPIFMEVDDNKLSSDLSALISSSQKDQVSSWYPEKKHGLFTYFFLKGIKEAANEGRTLTVADMESYLMGDDRVGDQAWRLYQREQTPQVLGNRNLTLFTP